MGHRPVDGGPIRSAAMECAVSGMGREIGILAVVWIGYDEPRAIGVPSSRGALPIWAGFLAEISGDRVRGGFQKPGGVERVEIDPTTGARALSGCPEHRPEYFLEGTVPTETCPRSTPGRRGFFGRLFGG